MSKRLKFFLFFPVLILLVSSLILPAMAAVPTVDPETVAPPFHLMVQVECHDLNFVFPMQRLEFTPSLGYYDQVQRQLEYSTVDLTYTFDNEFGDTGKLSASLLTYGNDNPFYVQWLPSSTLIGEFYTSRQCHSLLMNLVDFSMAQYGFNNDMLLTLDDCYLSDDFGLNVAGDGIVFMWCDRNGDPVAYSDTGTFDLKCKYFFAGDAQQRRLTIEDTSIVSYYEVLYHSDYDFRDNHPDQDDLYTFDSYYAEFASYDFSSLSADQIEKLQYCLAYVGSVYGVFEIEGKLLQEFTNLMQRDFFIRYFNATPDWNVSNFIVNVETAVNKDLTGFERMTKFIGTSVAGFLSVEIMPDFSLGGLVVIILSFSIVMWWLKVFAGG